MFTSVFVFAASCRPLCFDELVGNGFSPQVHPASVTHRASEGSVSYTYSTAMSGRVMRGGRHFVEFTIINGDSHAFFGVVRPISLTNGIDVEADWGGSVNPVLVSPRYNSAISEKFRSQRTTKWGDSNIHCCAYCCDSGHCYYTGWDSGWSVRGWRTPDWQGSEELVTSTIGLLLDLDGGTLSVFKDGRRLGVMKNGLDGEYCWFVTTYSNLDCTVNISKSGATN